MSAFTNAPTITISTPIKNSQGIIVGVIAADISLKSIGEIAGSVKIGKNGYIDVVDNKGVFLATVDQEKVKKGDNIAELGYVKSVLGGKEGGVEDISTRGDKTITVFVPMEKLKWGVSISAYW